MFVIGQLAFFLLAACPDGWGPPLYNSFTMLDMARSVGAIVCVYHGPEKEVRSPNLPLTSPPR